MAVKFTVLPNGPYLLEGEIEITGVDGKVETQQKAAFCRCGASSKKPFCDGAHRKIDFKDPI